MIQNKSNREREERERERERESPPRTRHDLPLLTATHALSLSLPLHASASLPALLPSPSFSRASFSLRGAAWRGGVVFTRSTLAVEWFFPTK